MFDLLCVCFKLTCKLPGGGGGGPNCIFVQFSLEMRSRITQATSQVKELLAMFISFQ